MTIILGLTSVISFWVAVFVSDQNKYTATRGVVVLVSLATSFVTMILAIVLEYELWMQYELWAQS